MNRQWTLREIAAATGGRLRGDPADTIAGVSVDSRTVGRGELFVAVRGEFHDGHEFAGKAVAAGAGAVMVERETVPGWTRIEVGDTLQALRDLAADARCRMRIPVVGITGSTGKTSTKDLLSAALGSGAWGSPRSFNNEVGVPLTVLGTPTDATHLVVEVGSRGAGDIAWLVPAIRPDVAVITNIGAVHLETFGSTEGLIAGKWELVEALGSDGVAVLPAGEARLTERGWANVVTFGGAGADVSASDVELDGYALPAFRLHTPSGTIRVRLGIAGRHQVANATAAAAAALAVGAGLGDIAAGLEQARGAAWRFEIHRGRFVVINDAYNANPDSTEAALRTVAEMVGSPLAVLGLMAELGPVAREEHLRIGRLAAALGFSAVVVGEDPGIAEGYGPGAVSVVDADDAYEAVMSRIAGHDAVMVKASRVVHLEGLAERLAEEAAR